MKKNTIERMLEAINKHITQNSLTWSKDNDLIIAKHQHNEDTNMDAIVFFPLYCYEWYNQIAHINFIESDKDLFVEEPCSRTWRKLDNPEDIVCFMGCFGFNHGKKGIYFGIDEFGTISVMYKDEFNN